MQGRSAIAQYIRDISDLPLLSRDEEYSLGMESLRGNEEARHKLILGNLKLVVKIAREYGSPDTLDLISEGNKGLALSIVEFDPTKGAKLSTYAQWWINKYIKRYLYTTATMVRVPISKQAELRQLDQFCFKYESTNNRPPINSEICEGLSITPKVLAKLQVYQARYEFSFDVGDFLLSTPATTQFEDQDYREHLETTLTAIACQTDKEILCKSFGVFGYEKMSLTDISKETGIHTEQVRKLRNKVLRKLRNSLVLGNTK